ncbi:chaperone NapD [Thermosulfurimonas sp. F29]|uniref:chaperone NapD n=1 Tax=Thermosulfurimonas sp. F29 TaxID=2867247 RepID=UPI001C83D299|nr:chaperone NapD [Thermosulfurimonas sp. F29]MBX6422164.1 chaperone NapD [Thermosulfurimonas sp. F29]
MPISGLVVCFLPEKLEEVRAFLEALPGVEVHGWNDRGEMVVVYEDETVEKMEKEIKEWPRRNEGILSVNVAYFHVEDEIERMEKGEYVPERPWKEK